MFDAYEQGLLEREAAYFADLCADLAPADAPTEARIEAMYAEFLGTQE